MSIDDVVMFVGVHVKDQLFCGRIGIMYRQEQRTGKISQKNARYG